MNTKDFTEDQAAMLSAELGDAYRDIERLEREKTGLESAVHAAKEEAARIAKMWSEVDTEHVDTRNKLHITEDKLEQAEQELEAVKREAGGRLNDLEQRLFDANASLHELKTLALIGPLTAEEWAEFRLLPNEEEDAELLRCCANTSAIRDDVFHLFRSYADDPILGRAPMHRIIHGVNAHHDLIEGDHPAAKRLLELLTRMAAYYGVPMDYRREDG